MQWCPQFASFWGSLVMQERGGVKKNHGHLSATGGWGQELDTTTLGPSLGSHSSLQFGTLCILLKDQGPRVTGSHIGTGQCIDRLVPAKPDGERRLPRMHGGFQRGDIK